MNKPMIPFIDQQKQYKNIAEKLKLRLNNIFDHGQFVLGPEVTLLESALQQRTASGDAITLANGTDALTLALMARNLKPGQVVFVPEFTYCATAGSVARLGGVPYFVDVDPHTYNLCPESLRLAIQACFAKGMKPTGVIAVDIFGVPADYDALDVVLKEFDLWLIQDAAQSFGATHRGRVVGSFAPLVATSFYPTKPLGCFGDGGAVFVNGENETASLIRSLRVHGQGAHRYDHIHVGMNSRLDTIQAAVLMAKLEVFNQEINARRHLASMYDALLDEKYVHQVIPSYATSVYAQYSILLPHGIDRDSWQAAMKSQGIPTMIYYPMLLSEQVAYAQFPSVVAPNAFSRELCRRIVALPMHGYMDEESTMRIVRATQQALKICS